MHWETYLELDPSGPWAEIARRHLARSGVAEPSAGSLETSDSVMGLEKRASVSPSGAASAVASGAA